MNKRAGLWDGAIAVGLGASYAAWLLRTTKDLGYARDEGFYFHAASSYRAWFELLLRDKAAALAPHAVDAHFRVNAEHPGLIKSLFALSNLFLQKKLHLFAMEGDSYRFPAIALAGLLIGLVYLWGTEARGRLTGLSAAVLLAAMPRFFYHAHLACFDVPIMTMWTLCAYAYWRSLRKGSWAWPLATGVLFGLALDTKHNSWFLPFFVVGHLLGRELLFWFTTKAVGKGPMDAALLGASRKRGLVALASMAALGPLVFYALWPWIWHDTAARLLAYARFHLGHEYYNMEFLGQNYWEPPMPRAYAWVMTAATVPTVTLALFAAGLLTRVRARLLGPLLVLWARLRSAPLPAPVRPRFDAADTDLLWLLGILVNYAAWVSPGTPIFGGTKHWMTAYPFLALFAGVGLDAAVRALRGALFRARRAAWARRLVAQPAALRAAAAACVFAAPIAETAHSHPWGLSSYVPLVGGAAGGATLGLNRTFWGYTTGAVTEYLNHEIRRGGSVYIHDTAGPSWDMLQTDGRLRRDIRGAWSVAGADAALYHHELHMRGQEFQAWGVYGTVCPAHIGGIDGVPVIQVYEKPAVGQGR